MTDDDIAVEITKTIAEYEGVEPDALQESLYEYIDPEALEALFRGGDGEVIFEYLGYEVTVESTGEIAVERVAEAGKNRGSVEGE